MGDVVEDAVPSASAPAALADNPHKMIEIIQRATPLLYIYKERKKRQLYLLFLFEVKFKKKKRRKKSIKKTKLKNVDINKV